MVVRTFFGITLLWGWNFLALWPLLSFLNLLTYECSTVTASSFKKYSVLSDSLRSHVL